MNTKIKILTQALMDEVNEVKGMKDTYKHKDEWWKDINWKNDEYKSIFDSLSERTRVLIVDAGLCPTCTKEDEEKEEGVCPEGEHMVDGECVPKFEEKDVLESNPGFTKPAPAAEAECPEGHTWNAEKKQCVPIDGFSDRPENKKVDAVERARAVIEKYDKLLVP